MDYERRTCCGHQLPHGGEMIEVTVREYDRGHLGPVERCKDGRSLIGRIDHEDRSARAVIDEPAVRVERA
jgi:hypothetical protein